MLYVLGNLEKYLPVGKFGPEPKRQKTEIGVKSCDINKSLKLKPVVDVYEFVE